MVCEEYFAHTAEGKDNEQLATHLHCTADLAKEFSRYFGLPETGELVGILHDIGKYQFNFQEKLRG
ncbi:MAG: hypothetical protein LBQ05_00885, partial [Christensenellaceae bacterium]|nr:hypothetical protein [Christensenellaceae bacterium]